MSHQISISFAGAILGIAGIVIVSTDAQAIVRTGGAYRGASMQQVSTEGASIVEALTEQACIEEGSIPESV